MTPLDAKNIYGDEGKCGYVNCYSCPLHHNGCPLGDRATGFEDCWAAIAEALSTANPYWERICAIAAQQRAKGMHTYGQGLEDNSADILKRIEHLQEELIDGLMYCEWIKENFAKEGRI